MSDRDWKLFVIDMVESTVKIENYVQGLTHDAFLTDSKTQDAVVRNLEIIGEAARRIPEEIRRRHPEIPWNQIVGLRNRLAHGYFVIDMEVVWQIAANELPALRKGLEAILSEERDEGG